VIEQACEHVAVAAGKRKRQRLARGGHIQTTELHVVQ
jgi:hypothetical protein